MTINECSMTIHQKDLNTGEYGMWSVPKMTTSNTTIIVTTITSSSPTLASPVNRGESALRRSHTNRRLFVMHCAV